MFYLLWYRPKLDEELSHYQLVSCHVGFAPVYRILAGVETWRSCQSHFNVNNSFILAKWADLSYKKRTSYPSKLWSNFFEKNIFFCFILNYFAKKFLKDNCCPGFLSQGLFLDLHVWYKIKIKVLTKYQKLPLCMVMLRLFVSVERCEWCPLQTAFFRICAFD